MQMQMQDADRLPPLSKRYGRISDHGSLMRFRLRSVSRMWASSTPADCLTHVMTPCRAGRHHHNLCFGKPHQVG